MLLFVQIFLVFDKGNPWVKISLPLPVSIYTRTHDLRVRVHAGFRLGMGKGIVPPDMGMDIFT